MYDTLLRIHIIQSTTCAHYNVVESRGMQMTALTFYICLFFFFPRIILNTRRNVLLVIIILL